MVEAIGSELTKASKISGYLGWEVKNFSFLHFYNIKTTSEFKRKRFGLSTCINVIPHWRERASEDVELKLRAF